MKDKKINTLESTTAPEAERAVIGELLLESSAIHEVSNILTPSSFRDSKLARIYKAIRALYDRSEKIDMVQVVCELKKQGTLTEVGGPAAVAQLTYGVGSSTNIRSHAEAVNEAYIRRLYMLLSQRIIEKASDSTIDIVDTVSEINADMDKIAHEMDYNNTATTINEAVTQSMADYYIREQMSREGKCIGITTGLRELDRMIRGFMPGQLVIIGARPAMGKTAFALHFAKNAAMEGRKVAFFSLEMNAARLSDRLLLSESEVLPQAFRSGRMTDNEKKYIEHASALISKLPILIDDTATVTIQSVKSRCLNLRRQGLCDIAFIDYLSLLSVQTSNKYYNREQEVSQISRQAKLMAKDLNIPVVLLAQLNRGIEGRINSKTKSDIEIMMPQLSDLRESGSIEQDADVVMFIHRPEYYVKDKYNGLGMINIAKQRDGPTGVVNFRHNESMTKITDGDVTDFDKSDEIETKQEVKKESIPC